MCVCVLHSSKPFRQKYSHRHPASTSILHPVSVPIPHAREKNKLCGHKLRYSSLRTEQKWLDHAQIVAAVAQQQRGSSTYEQILFHIAKLQAAVTVRRTSDQSPRVQSSKPFSFTLFLRRSCSAAVHATPSLSSPSLPPDHAVAPHEPRSSPLPLYPAAADISSCCCSHPALFPLPVALCHIGCGTDGANYIVAG